MMTACEHQTVKDIGFVKEIKTIFPSLCPAGCSAGIAGSFFIVRISLFC